MAEARRVGKNSLEMLEHNCPVLEIASKYQEACWTEQQLFTRLLGARSTQLIVQPWVTMSAAS